MGAEKYGLPIASADNIFDILRSMGLAEWKRIGEPIQIDKYLKKDLTEEEVGDLKYLPEVNVATFEIPGGGSFRGFQLSGISGVRVFTLIEGFVPVCAEFQHGCEEVVLDLPGGHIEDGENLTDCAMREFEEEVGIALEEVIPLGSKGILISARRKNARSHSFIGIIKKPLISRGQNLKQHLDKNERLKVVLVSLDDWLKLIDRELVQSYSIGATFLALRWLGEIEGFRL